MSGAKAPEAPMVVYNPQSYPILGITRRGAGTLLTGSWRNNMVPIKETGVRASEDSLESERRPALALEGPKHESPFDRNWATAIAAANSWETVR